jgi:hypothetical protein
VSGRIEVTQTPSPLASYQLFIEVRYRHFADRRGFVIDGVESSYYDRPALYGSRSLYSANLVLSGRHAGFLRASDVAIDTGSIGGKIESRVDRRHLTLGPLP